MADKSALGAINRPLRLADLICKMHYCGVFFCWEGFERHYYLSRRQGPTYVLDKSALPVPQTGFYARRNVIK